MKIITEELKIQIQTLPHQPGVYQYYNSNNEIIYIGKAKDLKKRVSSYFNKLHDHAKTNVLVKNISYLKYIVVDTEEDALLLENNLIKEYQPRYNVLLKDGKTYPSICITNEEFPRIYKTRSIIRNGSQYFGPYSNNFTVDAILEIVHQLYPIRTCRLPLRDDLIAQNKFKVCLQYHIHKCKGPCEGLETKEEYREHIESVRKIIQGDANEISKMLLKKMNNLAMDFKYEEAHAVKLKYELIENFKAKTIIANTIVENTDVFGFDEDINAAYVSILRVSKGSIVQGYTIEYRKKLDETKEEILEMGVLELRTKLNSNSKEVVLPFAIDLQINGVTATIPQRNDRKKLLDLAMQNVKLYKLEKLKQNEKLNPDQRAIQILDQIKEKLKLPKIPMHIECFDNSNIQGSDAVAACVVFKKAKPAKSEYRKYNIKTVVGPDDYASMREVVKRRYDRLMNENQSLPDLIVADGGIGQMEIIRQVIENELNISIPIIGLAKDNKHKTREILVGFPPQSVGLKPTDQIFKFFANLQDEVHRFAIQFHRDKRSKAQTSSELDKIRGIGEKTKKDLLTHFKSTKRISLADISEIEKIVGKSRASVVYNHFHPNEVL